MTSSGSRRAKGFPAGGPADGTLCAGGNSHATTSFEYFITKDGWNPDTELTRSALESQPFLTVPFGGQRPPTQVSHSGTLPTRSGHHLILAVWTIADTPNAFYQCSDVQFG